MARSTPCDGGGGNSADSRLRSIFAGATTKPPTEIESGSSDDENGKHGPSSSFVSSDADDCTSESSHAAGRNAVRDLGSDSSSSVSRRESEVAVKLAITREKNRAKQKRFYDKAKVRSLCHIEFLYAATMTKTLRAQKEALQQQYNRLLEVKPEMHPKRLVLPEHRDVCIAGKSRTERARILANLKLVGLALQEQKHWHTQALENAEESSQKLLDILLSEHRLFTSAVPRYLEMLLAEHQVLTSSILSVVKRLTAEDCEAIRDEARRQIHKLKQNEHFCNSRRGVGGWEEIRSSEEDVFQWSMQKEVKCHRADEVSRKTWGVFTDPERLAKLYSPQVSMSCRVVHVVDDDNVVMFQQFRGMDKRQGLDGQENLSTMKPSISTAKALSLVSFLRTEKGYMTIMHGLRGSHKLPRERKSARSPSESPSEPSTWMREVWTDLFCWFSGSAPTIGNNASFWNLEVLMLAVNWEAMVFGTGFTQPRIVPSAS